MAKITLFFHRTNVFLNFIYVQEEKREYYQFREKDFIFQTETSRQRTIQL